MKVLLSPFENRLSYSQMMVMSVLWASNNAFLHIIPQIRHWMFLFVPLSSNVSNFIPLIFRPPTICTLAAFLLESLWFFLKMQLHLQCKATAVCGEIRRRGLFPSSLSLLCVSQLGVIDLHGMRKGTKAPNSPVISVSRSLNQALS